MKHDCCENCYYWDYIDDSESNAKICYLIVEDDPDHPAACLSEKKLDYIEGGI